jgi:hypothetical protein
MCRQSVQQPKNSTGIAYGITMFEGDSDEMRKTWSKELTNVTFVPRCISLDLKQLVSQRHFLYLNLDLAEFSHGVKATQRNLMCKVQLRDLKGKPVPDCLSRGLVTPLTLESRALLCLIVLTRVGAVLCECRVSR